MKRRLQKLVVLGLAVATVAGSSVSVYAAEIMPKTKAEVTTESEITLPKSDTPALEQSEDNENSGEEQKQNAGEEQGAKGTVEFPTTWDGDLVLKIDGMDLANVKSFTIYGTFLEGVADYSMWVTGNYINAENGTVTFPKSSLEEAVKSQNQLLKEEGINKQLSELTDYVVSEVYVENKDGVVEYLYFKGDAPSEGFTLNCKNPLFENESNPGGGGQGEGQKPGGDGGQVGDQQQPSVKPQTDNPRTSPKTGDIAGVAGLMTT